MNSYMHDLKVKIMTDTEMDVTTVFARNPRGSLYTFDDFTLCDSTFVNDDDDDDESEGTECSEDASHECMYCGLRMVGVAVMCAECGKWFCNGRNRTPGSHIVHHLVRSKHKQVMTDPAGPLGHFLLECYECKSRNVFRLGFVTVDSGAAAVVLKCRGTCTDKKDRDEWRPIIEDLRLVQWIAVSPTAERMRAARPVAMVDVVCKEEAWNRESEATLDLGVSAADDEKNRIAKVKVKYADGREYQRVFGPLVQLEASCDKLLKERQVAKCVLESVQKAAAFNDKIVVRLRIEPNDVWPRMSIGEDLSLQHWTGERRGTVVQLSDSYERVITVETNAPVDWPVGTDLTVRLVWKSVPYDRMLRALDMFAKHHNCVSQDIRSTILGRARHKQPLRTVSGDLKAPGLPNLNRPQTYAVRHALSQCVSLVHGPPGTGKTVTCATIVYHLSKLGSVLVCAPSNTAADHLTMMIAKTGVQVVRLMAPALEAFDRDVSHLCVHNKIYEAGDGNDTLRALLKIKNSETTMGATGSSKYNDKAYRKLKTKAEIAYLRQAQVVCTTCSAAGDRRLESLSFRSVVVDESVQATEPECMIPVVRDAQQLVLIGDQCQLGPVIVSKKACKAGLNQSLFERLIRLGARPARLEIQYRMHPELSRFPSSYFYDGLLQNGVSAEDRSLPRDVRFPWPNPDKPIMFYASTGAEELSPSGTSYLNRWEADYVERITAAFLAGGLEPEQIGIITPYEGQRTYLAQTMMSSNNKHPFAPTKYARVEIASVDSFQGREKDLIIVSCVRSNENQGVGFLDDPRRMNVALTRAKYGLLLVGNPHILSKHPMWHSLLCYYRDNGVLVEGPLNNMSPSNVRLTTKSEPVDRRAQSTDVLRRDRPKPVRKTPQIMGVPESMIFARLHY